MRGKAVAVGGYLQLDTVGTYNGFNDSITNLTAFGDRLYFTEDADSVWRTTGKSGTLLRVARLVHPEIVPIDPNGPANDRIYVQENPPTGPSAKFYSLKGDSLVHLVHARVPNQDS